MDRTMLRWGGLVALVAAVGLYGCSSSSTPAPGGPELSTPAPESAMTESESPMAHEGHADHGDHGDHGDHSGHAEEHAGEQGGAKSDMEKMKEGLAKLSEADRASAEKQHVCPVSGQMLGTMGAPVKVNVKGRDVWLCCSGCESQLRADPDKYLAKLSP